ncbi:ROK family protein [Leifsonia naganoensis]|uniref:Putative NBD/HSP70 family sugar kinase n=1 Tax=Leifsonia naganoensis TaxID=150025 RepID=A0A853DX18_9MICO|nr:ROK family protein [Leifsonia naganoensis]NYK10870.1 putative NBD/HSP70 family sugar kinase [Leifsonia naganoensis]
MRLGIDIGGTKTDAVAVDESGVLAHRIRLATGFGSPAVVETALTAVSRIGELTGIDAPGFSSIGIGIPGLVDTASGEVAHAVNLGVDRLPLGGELAERLGVRVRVENDVKAAALGAYDVLGLAGTMAYLNLGTGMAAGIVVGGRLWRGTSGIAGEIGHIPIDPLGAECACGQRGCLETVASGSGIARQWRTDDPLPARSLFAAAAAGDGAAQAIKDRLAEGIAAAVRVLVLAVDVDTVVIGGGLSHLGDPLLGDVHEVLEDWERTSPFLASLALPQRVRLVPPGSPVAALGAAIVGGTHG